MEHKPIFQQTLKNEIVFEGIGVHSGAPAKMVLAPAGPDQGVRVVHTSFPADIINIGAVVPEEAAHATVLRAMGWSVSTVEHVMAALYGMGIDNCLVIVEQEEVPILDGSAYPFVESIKKCGILKQAVKRKFLCVQEHIRLQGNSKNVFIDIFPPEEENSLFLSYHADFGDHVLGAKTVSDLITEASFELTIARARTFGLLSQWPALKASGLARGSSLENTLVIGSEGFLNQPRFEGEWAWHKLLDLLGDLYLLGHFLSGRVYAYGSGHAINRKIIEHSITHKNIWALR